MQKYICEAYVIKKTKDEIHINFILRFSPAPNSNEFNFVPYVRKFRVLVWLCNHFMNTR